MLPLTHLLPLRVLEMTLQFTEPTKTRLFHQPALSAWLRHLASGQDQAYEHYLSLDAPESGCLQFQAADYYRFTLIATAGGEAVLETLLARLKALPRDVVVKDKRVAFRDNLRFVEARDLFSQNQIQDVAELTPFTFEHLQQETEIWQLNQECILRWLSPVRLLLPKNQRAHQSDEMRFCRHKSQFSFELFNDRLHDTLAHLLRQQSVEVPARQTDDSPRLLETDGFWLDIHYQDATGKAKPMGGFLGTLRLDLQAMPFEQRGQLVLGQYLGIGQRRTFGWGRYRLEDFQGQHTILRTLSANSLLGDCTPEQLFAAYRHVTQEDDAAFDEVEEQRLSNLYDKFVTGHYQIPLLQEKQRVNEQRGLTRTLQIPPLIDRVLQRMVAQILTPALDSIMYQGSFGFRQGHSRHQAAQMIQKAYEQGYRWVFESDVHDFFDSIQWSRLQTRLMAFFGEDPIVDWVMAWVRAPLQKSGERVERSAGLPQGSPLSPVLANMMLDDFDSDLDNLGLKLVRFADDFVVLCRQQEDAEKMATLVHDSLAEVGLKMNLEKTGVRSFEQGFRFLGFLFMNSLVLDVGGEKAPQVMKTPAKPQTQTVAQRLEIGQMAEDGTLVFVTGAPTIISTEEHRLQVTRVVGSTQDTMPSVELDLPWRQVKAVILIGGQHHITTPALRAAMHHQVPVHFADAGGDYQGSTLGSSAGQASSELWLAQLAWFGHPDNRLQAANALVKARLLHQREVLRRRNVKHRFDTALEELKRLANRSSVCSDLNTLRGLEGAGAQCYFKALRQIVPEAFEFDGRHRRPPTDPFNALLSLGYTILFAHVEMVVRANGLLPWIGIYHKPHGNHPVLVSDLMEPFRHLVERVALEVLETKQLKLEDFITTEQGGCYLTHEARRRYLAKLSEQFETPFRGQQWEKGAKLKVHLQYQVSHVVNWIRGQDAQFYVWRMH